MKILFSLESVALAACAQWQVENGEIEATEKNHDEDAGLVPP